MNNFIIFFVVIIFILIFTIYIIFKNKDKYIRIFPPFQDSEIYDKFYILNTPILPLVSKVKNYSMTPTMPHIYILNPKYLCPIRNQKECGACWAFVIASMLSDDITIRIYKFGKNLNVQELLTCYPKSNGCEGAAPEDVLIWLEKTQFKINIGDEYSALDQGYCEKMADTGISVKKNSVVSLCTYLEDENVNKINKVLEQNIFNMKNHIYNYGPIFSTLTIYSDFLDFPGNVPYQKNSNSFLGGHAIEIIGWCDAGVDIRKGYKDGYWVCKNSWGKTWAPRYDYPGYFAIRMGHNECGVESRTGGAQPNVEYLIRNKNELGKLVFTTYKDYIKSVLINKVCVTGACIL